MCHVHSYLGLIHVLDIDSAALSAEDNLFAAPKQQPVGKRSVNLPTDDWLWKMDSLNLTLVQGYLSRISLTGSLQTDQYVKPSKLHAKWYGFHTNQDRLAGSVTFWHCDSSKLNSAYSWIARSSDSLHWHRPHTLYHRIPSVGGRRLHANLLMSVIRQADSASVSAMFSRLCSHS